MWCWGNARSGSRSAAQSRRISLFESAHEEKPHKNACSFDVPAALTGIKRGNVEGGSKILHPLEANLQTVGRVLVFCLPPATWKAAEGEGACRRSLADFRPMPPLRGHPPRGRGGTGASNGVCGRAPRKSCRLWEAGMGQQGSGRGVTLRQRQQAGALQNASRSRGRRAGRGSVWRAAACRRFIGPAGTEGDPGRPVCRVAALGPDGRG